MFDGHVWCPAAGWTVRRARILIIIAAGSSGPRGSGGRRGHQPREWRLHSGFLCLGCRRFDFFSSSREEESFHKLTQLSKRRSVDPCFSERDSRHAGSRGRSPGAGAEDVGSGRGQGTGAARGARHCPYANAHFPEQTGFRGRTSPNFHEHALPFVGCVFQARRSAEQPGDPVACSASLSAWRRPAEHGPRGRVAPEDRIVAPG